MTEAESTLPDSEVCRTKDIWSDWMMVCLVDDPKTCPFVIPFGDGFYCHHPDRKKFEKPTDRSV